MGILIVTEFVTLDGVAQAPGAVDEDPDGGFAHGGWQAPVADPESGGVIFEQAARMDALLLGRRTYEIFADYWPDAPEEIPFTGLLNGVPEYVASRTLAEPLSWQESTLLPRDLVGSVAELKARHDEIHVIGSLDLLQSLLRAGLVDRLDLWMYPRLLGSGKRVFADGSVPTVLHLTESVTYRAARCPSATRPPARPPTPPWPRGTSSTVPPHPGRLPNPRRGTLRPHHLRSFDGEEIDGSAPGSPGRHGDRLFVGRSRSRADDDHDPDRAEVRERSARGLGTDQLRGGRLGRGGVGIPERQHRRLHPARLPRCRGARSAGETDRPGRAE